MAEARPPRGGWVGGGGHTVRVGGARFRGGGSKRRLWGGMDCVSGVWCVEGSGLVRGVAQRGGKVGEDAGRPRRCWREVGRTWRPRVHSRARRSLLRPHRHWSRTLTLANNRMRAVSAWRGGRRRPKLNAHASQKKTHLSSTAAPPTSSAGSWPNGSTTWGASVVATLIVTLGCARGAPRSCVFSTCEPLSRVFVVNSRRLFVFVDLSRFTRARASLSPPPPLPPTCRPLAKPRAAAPPARAARRRTGAR